MTVSFGSAPRSALAAGILSSATTVVCLLPAFLMGAITIQIGDEFGFGSAGLGLAVAAFWTANAIGSIPLGHLTDRLGAIASIRIATIAAAAVGIGVALGASRWWHLVAWMVVAGASHAIGHPAANSLLVSAVRPERLGHAFGFKGAAPPAASMMAGFSVPFVALTLGWRWSFAFAACLALVILVCVRRHRDTDIRSRAAGPRVPLRDRSIVVILAVGFGLATAASTSVTVFYVESAVHAGTAQDMAGTMLAIGSFAAIVARVVTGVVSDRMTGHHLEVCAATLLVGGGGVVLLATARPSLMAVGVVVAMVGSWGFQSMFWYRVLRAYRDVPGRVTGAVQPGSAVGGAVGPLVFGFIAERTYGTAWAVIVVVTALAALMLLLSARRLASRAI